MRWHAQPTPPMLGLRVIERAAARSVVTGDGCWVFTGATSQGYGAVGAQGRTWRLHRLAYLVMVESDIDGLTLDHLCRNRLCWNPEHLEPVPRGLNVLRGDAPTVVAFREGRCLKGHPATDFYHHSGRRQCAACVRENARKRRRRARSEGAA